MLFTRFWLKFHFHYDRKQHISNYYLLLNELTIFPGPYFVDETIPDDDRIPNLSDSESDSDDETES